jgi:hypothetical protein
MCVDVVGNCVDINDSVVGVLCSVTSVDEGRDAEFVENRLDVDDKTDVVRGVAVWDVVETGEGE